jgi:hypothetical protein
MYVKGDSRVTICSADVPVISTEAHQRTVDMAQLYNALITVNKQYENHNSSNLEYRHCNIVGVV